MKFAAAMTLYNPETSTIDNLKKTAELFEILYVYDNTEKLLPYVEDIKKTENVIYLWNGTNDGLPIAFNRMLELAYKDNVDYLCTLDQDSLLTPWNIQQIESYIKNGNMENVAAVAPFPTGTEKRSKKSIEEVEWVICSGCFLNLTILKENGIKYDEAYFVDRFDADICMQIRRKKLRIIRLNDVTFNHRCGDEYGKHSYLRHYYMFRNRYYYNHKYYLWPVSVIRTFLQNLRHARWVYGNRKEVNNRKLIASVARNDYKKGCLGKIRKETIDIICGKFR